jgi:hypothetical protein
MTKKFETIAEFGRAAGAALVRRLVIGAAAVATITAVGLATAGGVIVKLDKDHTHCARGETAYCPKLSLQSLLPEPK